MFQAPKGEKYLLSVIEQEDGSYDAACIYDDLRDDKPAEIVELIECNNVIGTKPDFLQVLESWYNDKLNRLEICIRFPKRCQ